MLTVRLIATWGLAAAVALLVISQVIAKAAEQSKLNGWIIHQQCTFLGDHVVYVCPFGVKAICVKSGLSIQSCPPFDQYVIYNLTTGKIFRIEGTRFRHPMEKTLSACNGFSFGMIPLVRERETVLAGVPCTVYKATATFADSQLARFKAKEFPSRNPRSVQLTTTDEMTKSPGANRMLSCWYCLPPAPGLPLQFNYRDIDNDQHEYLALQKCERALLKDSDFALPPSLKSASSVQDVTMGNVYDQEAVQMMFGGEDRK